MPLRVGANEETDFEREKRGTRDGNLIIGVQQLDERDELQGVPAGSVITILGDPKSQGDLFNYHLAYTRPTSFITLTRDKQQVKNQFYKLDGVPNHLTIQDFRTSPDWSDVIEEAAMLEQNGNLVVDPVTEFESLRADDIEKLKKDINDKDGLAFLYFNKNNVDEFTQRELNLLYVSDGIINVTTEVEGNRVNHNMYFSKLNGQEFPTEKFTLQFEEKLSIDGTSGIS